MTTLSLITACYRSAATLPATLDSVRAQGGVDLEYLVLDGGSDDGTRALLARAGDVVDRWVSEADAGVYHALNRGFAMARGDVLGLLHADDVLAAPDTLARVLARFDDPRVQAVYGDLVYVRRDRPLEVLRYWRAGAYHPRLLRRGWMPPHPTVFVRRGLVERFGGFDTGFSIAADYEWVLRVFGALGAGEVAYLPEVLVRMRVGGLSNRSLANVLRKSREDYRALRRHRAGGALALAWKNLSKLRQFTARAPDAGRDERHGHRT